MSIFHPSFPVWKDKLHEFAKKHPDCTTALESWYRIVKHTKFNSFAELRQTFPSADQVGELTVFNIGGNKARLITAIHYNKFRIYIRHVLSHKEYDRETWKEK
jgi:mRNA interferase HigB